MTKRILGLATFLAMVVSCGIAGAQSTGSVAPDAQVTFNFTATGRADVSGKTIQIDNRFLGCTTFHFSYTNTGFSVVSIEMDEASNNAGVPGSWAVFGNAIGVVASGTTLPLTSTTGGQASGYKAVPFVSINVNTATGTGNITGLLSCYRPGNGANASTPNSLPVVSSGTVASGSAVSGNPVLVGASDGTNAQTLRTGPSAQTGAAPVGLLGISGTTVTYTPTQLGVNALAYGAGGTTAASNTIDLRGAKSFTLSFNGGAGITTLNEIVFAEDGTTTLVTLSAATGCAATTQALINQPEAGNAATAQNTCTIGTSAKFPLRAVAFTWSNTNATPGTVTGRMFVGY